MYVYLGDYVPWFLKPLLSEPLEELNGKRIVHEDCVSVLIIFITLIFSILIFSILFTADMLLYGNTVKSFFFQQHDGAPFDEVRKYINIGMFITLCTTIFAMTSVVLGLACILIEKIIYNPKIVLRIPDVNQSVHKLLTNLLDEHNSTGANVHMDDQI